MLLGKRFYLLKIINCVNFSLSCQWLDKYIICIFEIEHNVKLQIKLSLSWVFLFISILLVKLLAIISSISYSINCICKDHRKNVYLNPGFKLVNIWTNKQFYYLPYIFLDYDLVEAQKLFYRITNPLRLSAFWILEKLHEFPGWFGG